MVLNRFGFAVVALFMLLAMTSAAIAHRDHDDAELATSNRAVAAASAEASGRPAPMVMRDRSSPVPRGFVARLADWLGRAHPMVVHFPLALFPMALLALVLARRAPEWMIAARFMVVAAGIAALPAALLGWFAGGWPSPGDEFTLVVHRWLGVGIAMAGLASALLVARRRGALPWAWTFAALLVINVALVAQGWFGGAMVHGADHLSW